MPDLTSRLNRTVPYRTICDTDATCPLASTNFNMASILNLRESAQSSQPDSGAGGSSSLAHRILQGLTSRKRTVPGDRQEDRQWAYYKEIPTGACSTYGLCCVLIFRLLIDRLKCLRTPRPNSGSL